MSALRILLLLVSVAFAQGTDPAEPPARPASPHFVPDRCGACHAPAAPGATAAQITWAVGTPDDTCRSCHEKGPHEVGMVAHRRGEDLGDLAGQEVAEVPAAFPLPGGKLACLTCHDEPACTGKPQDPANPRFFRGGPYERLGGLCQNCHAVGSTARFNPHQAMEEGGASSSTCEFCHDLVDGKPDLDLLRTSRADICYGCHRNTRHAGSAEHMQVLEPAMKVRAEAGGLPLTQKGAVFCDTCHDPHPAGSEPGALERAEWAGKPVFTDPWLGPALAPYLKDQGTPGGTDLTPWTRESSFLREPLRGNALCGTCHTAADTERRRREDRR